MLSPMMMHSTTWARPCFVPVPWRTVIRDDGDAQNDAQLRDYQQVRAMQSAFEATGGLVPIGEVVERLAGPRGPTAETVRQWVRTRQAIGFEWRGDIWLPMFQFNRFTSSVHAALRPLLRDLASAYDPFESAHWFVQPHHALRWRPPVDLLVDNLESVLNAAKLDRFIAAGELE